MGDFSMYFEISEEKNRKGFPCILDNIGINQVTSSYFTNVLVKIVVKAVKKSKKDTCENFQRLKESDKQSITKQWCIQIK